MENRPIQPLPASASSHGDVSMRPPERDFGSGPTPNPSPMTGSASQTSGKSTSSATPASGLKPSNAKVAIPRHRTGVAPRFNRRVPRACESCRQRKTKCSGDTPVCRQCRELRVQCQYPVSWRERTKKQIERLAVKAQDFEILLREIGSAVEGRTAERIRTVLDKVGNPSVGVRLFFETTLSNADQHSQDAEYLSNDPSHSSVTPQDEKGEQEVSSPSSVGSLENIDRVEEDLNRTESSRATGYLGKNSEITWMQRVQKEAEQRANGQPGMYEPGQHEKGSPQSEFALNAMNYHLDDIDISIPGPVQMYWIPPRQLADQLFEDYLETVHPFFPIINRTLFTAQYRTFFDSDARPGDKWLAILNVIFAISAKHAHLIEAPWRGDEQDHLVYLTRARFLSMNGDVLFSHPDLQQVQVEGLIAFYLLASDQINRAWRISALAVRSAISLGINMKIVNDSTPSVSKEARCRVWWCLYTFEHILGIMTGRATCILDGICTVPLPLPFDDENLRDSAAERLLNDMAFREERMGSAVASSSVRLMSLNPAGGKTADHRDKPLDNEWLKNLPPSNALCFLYYVDLTVVAQEIVNKLYSTESAKAPWSHIENRIGELRSRIELWYSGLPKIYDFMKKDDADPAILRGRLCLAFHYHSSRITLGRPCLCRRDAGPMEPGQEETFSHKMAVMTLESALQMLDLIPDEPDAVQLYQVTPWWCVLHYLMQAASVLLLEVSFGNLHVPSKEATVFAGAKKAIRWVFAMSEHSIASRRAWQLCDSSLRRIAKGMNLDVSDMPWYMYEPKPSEPMHNGENPSDVLHGSTVPQTWNPNVATAGGLDLHSIAEYPMSSSIHQLTTSVGDGTVENDSYFPYDPISGEFIRSFFPNPTDEGPWSHWS